MVLPPLKGVKHLPIKPNYERHMMLAESEIITGWKEQQPETPPAIVDAYMRLAGAVVERAIRDAATNTPEGHRARAWLLSDDAVLYLEGLDVERDALEGWLQAGAVIPKQKRK